MYDVSSYVPGEGYDQNPDTGANPGGEQPPASAPAPTGAPAPAPKPAAPSGRFAHMSTQALREAAHASAPKEGEAQSEEQPAAEQQQQTIEPYELKVPEFVDHREVTEERSQWLGEFQTLAPTVGIAAPEAQELVNTVIDAAVALDYVRRDDADRDDARLTMTQLFGEKAGTALIENAQKYARSRGEEFLKYLDSSNLGNDPSVVVALAFAQTGWFSSKVAPSWASQELTKVMASKEYASGDRYTLLKSQILSRIANRNATDPLATAAATAQAKPAAPPAAAPAPGAARMPAADARAELAKMMNDKSGPLLNAGHKDHAEAVRRFHQLAAQV